MQRDRHRYAGILTLRAPECRISVIGPSFAPCGVTPWAFLSWIHFSWILAAWVVVPLLLLLPAPGWATPPQGNLPERQPVSDISRAAEAYLERRIARTDRRITPRAGSLDPRLQLARCDAALEGFLRTGTKIGNRTIVGVRCGGSIPWKVYVPVNLIEMRPVLVARRALPRGHLLIAADLVAEERDVSRLSGGYLENTGAATGRRLKRQIVSGSAISPSMLETQIVVRRGQTVTLVVRNDSLNIRMAGKALTDGALNERIRVENTVSRRIVEGFVRSPEHVEVMVR
ncbi:MAG: flagellar basal body P-ring formation chaperone FlgA [Woeseia sp.]